MFVTSVGTSYIFWVFPEVVASLGKVYAVTIFLSSIYIISLIIYMCR